MVFHFNPVISLLDSHELKKDILFVILVTAKFSTAVCQKCGNPYFIPQINNCSVLPVYPPLGEIPMLVTRLIIIHKKTPSDSEHFNSDVNITSTRWRLRLEYLCVRVCLSAGGGAEAGGRYCWRLTNICQKSQLKTIWCGVNWRMQAQA